MSTPKRVSVSRRSPGSNFVNTTSPRSRSEERNVPEPDEDGQKYADDLARLTLHCDSDPFDDAGPDLLDTDHGGLDITQPSTLQQIPNLL